MKFFLIFQKYNKKVVAVYEGEKSVNKAQRKYFVTLNRKHAGQLYVAEVESNQGLESYQDKLDRFLSDPNAEHKTHKLLDYFTVELKPSPILLQPIPKYLSDSELFDLREADASASSSSMLGQEPQWTPADNIQFSRPRVSAFREYSSAPKEAENKTPVPVLTVNDKPKKTLAQYKAIANSLAETQALPKKLKAKRLVIDALLDVEIAKWILTTDAAALVKALNLSSRQIVMIYQHHCTHEGFKRCVNSPDFASEMSLVHILAITGDMRGEVQKGKDAQYANLLKLCKMQFEFLLIGASLSRRKVLERRYETIFGKKFVDNTSNASPAASPSADIYVANEFEKAFDRFFSNGGAINSVTDKKIEQVAEELCKKWSAINYTSNLFSSVDANQASSSSPFMSTPTKR